MSEIDIRKLTKKYINKDKWWDILSRFIDVLRMNLFIIDVENRMVLPPEEGKFGSRFIIDSTFRTDIHRQDGFIEQFDRKEPYYENVNQYQLATYAIPIKTDKGATFAYMVIGPVIMNKRLSIGEYEQLAEANGIEPNVLIDEVSELRVVSNVMMNSILELLTEIVTECVDKSIKEHKLDELISTGETVDKNMINMINDMSSTIRLDELLGTLLDSALKITQSECGSVMVVDGQSGEMTIKVSRGIDLEIVNEAKIKIGEGISGIAAEKEEDFIINEDSKSNNRIGHLMQRPDVKHALVIPLKARGKVFGVLNLHTKDAENRIENKIDHLKHLTNLISSAL